MRKRLFTLLLIANIGLLATGCGDKTSQQTDLRDQGIALMDSGDYEGAVADFNQALDLSIGQVTDLEIDINYYKAAALFRSGDYDGAISVYTALIDYDKGNFKPYFLRGSVYADTGSISKACQDYDDAIAINKRNYEVYIEIYQNLLTTGYSDQAYEYINQLLNVDDKTATANYYKGRAYYLLEQYDSAEEYLQKAVDKNITDAKLYLAKLYQDTGDTEKAQTLLEEYASSDGINSEAMVALGDIEIANGNYETALSYYQTGLGLDDVENYQALYKGEVVALEYLGRFDEAKEVLTQYLDLYPSDEEAQNELIFLKSR